MISGDTIVHACGHEAFSEAAMLSTGSERRRAARLAFEQSRLCPACRAYRPARPPAFISSLEVAYSVDASTGKNRKIGMRLTIKDASEAFGNLLERRGWIPPKIRVEERMYRRERPSSSPLEFNEVERDAYGTYQRLYSFPELRPEQSLWWKNSLVFERKYWPLEAIEPDISMLAELECYYAVRVRTRERRYPVPQAWADAISENRYSGLHDLISVALGRVANALELHASPYIAFSGGKDSSAVLALVHALDPFVPIVWSDDELEMPETVSLMEHMQERYDTQFKIWLGHATHGGWFQPWRRKPYWREPLPGSLSIRRPMEDYAREQGIDLTFLGLRRAESRGRDEHLRATGPYYVRKQGAVCCPILDWHDGAVRRFIEISGAPWNAAYDRMSAAGIEPEHQRVGPLPLAFARQIEAWPGLLPQLEERYGNHW